MIADEEVITRVKEQLDLAKKRLKTAAYKESKDYWTNVIKLLKYCLGESNA